MIDAHSPTHADARLQRLLGGAELAAVRRRLRRKFEQQGDSALVSFRLGELDAIEYHALCQLTGRAAGSGKSIHIDLAQLDASLRAANIADSLRQALEQIDGPIVNRWLLQRDLHARWAGLANAEPWCSQLQAWLALPTALALLKRLGKSPQQALPLLASVDHILRRLPAGGLPRSQLAAETLGDAHALDTGRPIATLVLAAWRHGETNTEPAQNAEQAADGFVRDIWARAGVLVNELARPALFLNLPPPKRGGGTWLPGEPAYLSLRQLLRAPPVWDVADSTIHVCENPNIVAIAADRLGDNCAPLLCTEGMPAAAQRTLLTQLVDGGAQLKYHGDFDWPGIRIGNYVLRTWQARAWRFSTADYLAALDGAPIRASDLGETRVDATWDATLAPTMQQHGLAIAEEAVVDRLLQELQQI